MMQRLLFSLFFFSLGLANAQCPDDFVVLGSQDEVDNFAILYPNCTIVNNLLRIGYPDIDTDITNLDGLSVLEGSNGPIDLIIIANPLLEDISGLSGLTQLKTVQIGNSPLLTSLDGLENVELIESSLNLNNLTSLTSISPLQNVEIANTEDGFDLSFARCPLITSFSGLFSPGTSLSRGINIYEMNGLTSLDGFEDVVEIKKRISIRFNENLQNIDALSNVLGTAGAIHIADNPALLNLNGFSGIEAISGDLSNGNNPIGGGIQITNNDLLTGLAGLTDIQFVGDYDGDTHNYIIQDNNLLSDINALSEINLAAIPDLNLQIIDNPNLSQCDIESICELLVDNANASILIDGNGSGCNNEPEVIIGCGVDLNIVSGHVRFDFLNDGCDEDDFSVPSVMIQSSDGTNVYSTFTNDQGHFQNFVGLEGTVFSSLSSETYPSYFDVSPATANSTFDGFGNEDIIDYCLTVNTPVNDLKITLVPLGQSVAGEDSEYMMIYENVGSTVLDADVTFQFDSGRQNFVSATPPPNIVDNGVLVWNLTNIFPFESNSINVTLNTLPPPINQPGDILILESSIVEDEGDESPVDNFSTIEQVIVASFTPNDLLVVQGQELPLNLLDQYLNYVVVFENLGTENVIDFQITTDLDPNLDWNSMRMLHSSHDYGAQIVNGNEVRFTFDYINLPPISSDPELGKGYIVFQIKPKSNLQVGDEINHQLSLQFDDMTPVVTETKTITIVGALGINVIEFINPIQIYPNPVIDQFHIQTRKGIEVSSITLYSLTGKEVLVTADTNISTSNLLSGVYFVTVETNIGPFVSKIVKK